MSVYTLEIEHRTTYRYEHAVRNSKNEARMTPATTPWQTIPSAELTVDPTPTYRVAYQDYFGTTVESFEVMHSHEHLQVVASAVVELSGTRSASFPPADVARAVEYLPQSPMTVWNDDVTSLAETLRRGSAAESVRAAVDWMRSQMTYEPGTTEVGTPVVEVLAARRGVCQDFAHLCCAAGPGTFRRFQTSPSTRSR